MEDQDNMSTVYRLDQRKRNSDVIHNNHRRAVSQLCVCSKHVSVEGPTCAVV